MHFQIALYHFPELNYEFEKLRNFFLEITILHSPMNMDAHREAGRRTNSQTTAKVWITRLSCYYVVRVKAHSEFCQLSSIALV